MQTNPAASPVGAPYTYYAFISYKRADSKWAAWLQRRLQAYRLPTRLCRKYRDLPKRLTPVFLDKENLTSGHLEGSLHAELAASRYLIVICSKNTQIEPYYVNQEIRMFLEAGHTPDQIIPFIVDDSPQPEKDCFPPALQELCAENTLLGVNINDSGKRNAFLKVVAYMHGLKLTEVESAEDRRRRRNGLIAALCALALVTALAVTGYALWDYYVPKVAYYLDYTTRNGLPVGIHELTEQEIASLNSHYTLITLGDRRYELRHENAMGSLVDQTNTEHQDRPIRAVYEAPVDGRLDKVTYYNRAGHPMLVMDYSEDLRTVDLEASGTEFTTSVFLNASTTAMASSAWAAKDSFGHADGKSAITRYLVNYDENGYVEMMRYADYTNRAIADYDGIYGLSYERDELGRTTVMTYLTHDENVVTAISRDAYHPMDAGVCGRRYEYTETDQLHKTTYFGADGQPILNSDGWMICIQHYGDEYSPYNPVGEEFQDAQGNLRCRNDGFAVSTVRNTPQGLFLDIRYLDEQRQPVMVSQGYARAELEYDENGYLVFARIYDLDDNRVTADDGSYGWRSVNDPQGYIIRQTAMDAHDTPISVTGHVAMSLQYDERGNVLSYQLLDENGLPDDDDSGISVMAFEYDPVTGLATKATRIGLDGKPVMCADGYAGWQYIYDDHGNIQREFWLDDQGQPVMQPEGYAGVAYEYDLSGHLLRETTLDENSQPCMRSEGYVTAVYRYDRWGNQIYEAFEDASGNLVMSAYNYAVYTCLYDGNLLLEYTYADENGLPMDRYTTGARGATPTRTSYLAYENGQIANDDTGCAIKYSEYDDDNNRVMTVYLNAANEQVTGPDGFSRERHVYENGVRVSGSYYNEKDQLLQSVLVDEAGEVLRRTSYAAYDESGALINGPEGYAITIQDYDSEGREISTRLLDAQGTPAANAEGVSSQVISYENDATTYFFFNPLEQLTAEYTYGANDQPRRAVLYGAYDAEGRLICGSEGYARMVYEYDEYGNDVLIACYDEKGDLTPGPNGHALAESIYENGRLVATVTRNERRQLLEELHFDEQGNRISALICNGYDESGQPIIQSGYFSALAVYNTEGTITGMYFYGVNDEPVDNANGFFSVEDDYTQGWHSCRIYRNHAGLILQEIRYNEAGQQTYMLVANGYDENGQPLENESGYASSESFYEQGTVRRRTYSNAQGFLIAENTYDEHGVRILIRNIAAHDENGQPAAGADGYAYREAVPNAQGKTTEIRFYGPDGEPVCCNAGYFRLTREYDAEGNQLSSAYYGTDGAPVFVADVGCASMTCTYAGGVISAHTAFDAQMRPITHAVYDAQGVLTSADMYVAWDENGSPVNGPEGYAVRRVTFAPDGSTVSTAYYDQNGDLVALPEAAE